MKEVNRPASAAPECLEREMRCAHQVIPMWAATKARGGHND
ncbi:hypothetical protein Tchar_02177 [Tepidimonas charontis]|uniref:Uncharacterized protein n=1 Tax=Tepidimonas charontis TaxID=2267262 RepID=A0A554X8D6_9BURK|nr:hypothetical protein Tchar_02177 [Tepidimonas charontis]